MKVSLLIILAVFFCSCQQKENKKDTVYPSDSVSTKEITDNMYNLFHIVAKEKNIKFEIITKDAPIVIKTDKMRLEQILKNLISNAIKFTEKGTVSLEIKVDSDNDKVICFIVKNSLILRVEQCRSATRTNGANDGPLLI